MAVSAKEKDFLEADWNHQLLNAIVEIQGAFIGEKDIQKSFDRMLGCLLEVTQSGYGFLGEVLYTEEDSPYLRTHAITDISWNKETKKLYDENVAKGFEFYNLNTLFGVTLSTSQVVISNDPKNDPRSGGLPKGHPRMDCYLGVPILHGNEMIGMLGIANRGGGYHERVVDALKPLLITAGSMISSMRKSDHHSKIEEELKGKHTLLNAVLNNIKESLVITNHIGKIKQVNAAAEDLFQLSESELIGKNVSQLLLGEFSEGYSRTLNNFLLTADKKLIDKRVEVLGSGSDKKSIPLEMSISDVILGNQKLFVNTFLDISERKKQECDLQEANKKLTELSETDELTSLPNRRFFEKNYVKDFNRSRKVNCHLALAIFDLDNFKAYNDHYGHAKGDECLKSVGAMFKDFFRRECEFPARVGGEEFAVVMTHMTKEECIASLKEFQSIVEKKKILHEFSNAPHVTFSIGLAMRSSSVNTTEVLYESADQSLYMAKEQGRDRLITHED